MSYAFSINNAASVGPEGFFLLKQLLVSQGWVVNQSSDGTTYSSSGDVITGAGASGAGQLGNNLAWFSIQAPSSGAALCVQRATAVTSYRVKVTVNQAFSGGTPGISRVPSATNEQVLLGSGTDASPAGSTFYAAATDKIDVIAGGSSEGYSYILSARTATTGVPAAAFAMDKMATFPAADTAPYVWYLSPNSTSAWNVQNVTTNGHCWFNYSGVNGVATFQSVQMGVPAFFSGSLAVGFPGLGSNAETAGDDVCPGIWGRVASLGLPAGYKGMSTLFSFSVNTRTNGDTLSLDGGSLNRVCYGTVTFPWNGTVPVL